MLRREPINVDVSMAVNITAVLGSRLDGSLGAFFEAAALMKKRRLDAHLEIYLFKYH